jgi:hypothetical protein
MNSGTVCDTLIAGYFLLIILHGMWSISSVYSFTEWLFSAQFAPLYISKESFIRISTKRIEKK